jgi:copper transport protein
VRPVLLALALLALTAPGASAHASLRAAEPASGAVLERAPAAVTFSFSEAVEGRFGSIVVYDQRGARVDTGPAHHLAGQRARFGASLPGRLPDGRYAATYRVVSADGHPIAGGVIFTVGTPAAAGPGAPSLQHLLGSVEAGPLTKTGFAAVRAVDSLATGLAIGLLAFLLLCWRPALAEVSGAGPDWRRASAVFAGGTWRLLRQTVIVGAVASQLGIVFEGAIAGGTSVWGALPPEVLNETLGTRFGLVWSAKLVLWGALGCALVRCSPERSFVLRRAALGADGQALGSTSRARLLALGLPAAGLSLAPALAGHASTQGEVLVLVPSVVAHVLAASVWLGGLVALAVLVPRATAPLLLPASGTRLLAAVLTRFSPLALGAVLALQLTGTVQSILYLRSLGDLLHDGFGRAVLIKVVLVLGLVGLGAVNRRRALPRLRRLAREGGGAGGAGALLRRTVRLEIGLLLAVLAVTGALTGLAPPSASEAGARAQPPPAAPAITVSRRLGPLAATARLAPARVGANTLTLRLRTAAGGRRFTGAQAITAQASLPGRGIGPLPITFRRTAPGTYAATGVQLLPHGRWRVALAVRVSDFDEFSSTFTVRVQR